ncbi:MAG: hypothetical protein IT457_01510 [Planctomycetes bacterium]|nr:hypothetical protein [Planctomycetota bacterium]
MTESQARSILRLTAIATILVGTIQSAQSAITWLMFQMPVGPSMYASEEDFVRPLRFGFFEDLVVPVCGFVLLAFSSGLARYVARRNSAQQAPGADEAQ